MVMFCTTCLLLVLIGSTISDIYHISDYSSYFTSFYLSYYRGINYVQGCLA